MFLLHDPAGGGRRIAAILMLLCPLHVLSSAAADSQWTTRTLPFPSGWIEDAAFADANTGWVLAVDQDANETIVLKTVDDGDSWTSQVAASGMSLKSIDFADSLSGYALGQRCFKTLDGGGSWSESGVYDPTWQFIYDVVCLSSTTAVAVGKHLEDGLCFVCRTDDGTSWTRPAYPTVAGNLNGVDFTDFYNGWAVGKDETSGHVLALGTKDGGMTWSRQTLPDIEGRLYDVSFADGQCGWAVGGTGFSAADHAIFLRTDDGGATWTASVAPPGVLAKGAHALSFQEGYVAVYEKTPSDSASLFYTDNGGTSWTRVGQALPDGYFEALQVAEVRSPGLGAKGVGSKKGKPLYASIGLPTFPQVLASIVVSPSNSALEFGEQQQFSAVGYDTHGDPMNPPISPVWSATAGSITQAGEYTAPDTEGDYTVTAGVSGSAVTGLAFVHVSSPVQVLASIVVSPSNSALEFGEQQQFSAVGYDANGDPMNPPIAPIWSATAGSITQAGEYTAPDTEGDYTVTAGAAGSAVTGLALVHVGRPYEGLMRVDVSPHNVNLEVGEQQLFRAVGYDAHGTPAEPAIAPTWSASGGTITQGGEYTATTEGTFEVKAEVSGTTVTGTATVRVGRDGRRRVPGLGVF